MHYSGAVYRPPSEARSLIVQCTLGCSHNKCAFCTMYKDKKFSINPIEQVLSDLDEARAYGRYIEKIFLADGDALVLPILTDPKKLDILLSRLGKYLIIFLTGFLSVFLCTVRKKSFFQTGIHLGKEILSHIIRIALWIFPVQSSVFVQVYCRDPGKIQIPLLIMADQFFVNTQRAGTRGQTHDTVRLLCHYRKDNIGSFSAYIFVISGFDNSLFSLSPFFIYPMPRRISPPSHH